MSSLLFKPADVSEEKPKKKKLSIFIDILCIIVIVCGVVWFFFGQMIHDYFVGLSFDPSPEMLKSIDSLNMTWRGNLVLRAAQPVFESAEAFNVDCPDDDEDVSTLGCYIPSNDRIYIYDIHSDELDGIKESVLAHETLHAIYLRLNDVERKNLDEELNNYYKTHKDKFGSYMDTYDEDQYNTELHSIIGQRVHYKDLTEPLQKHYSKYFVDQDKIVDFYDKYHVVIDDLANKIDESKAEIDDMYVELSAKRQAYRTNLEKYNTDVMYHNNQAAMGFYSESRYWSLKKREAELDNELKALNDYIDSYNQKARDYNDLLARQQQLYGRMNSKSGVETEEAE